MRTRKKRKCRNREGKKDGKIKTPNLSGKEMLLIQAGLHGTAQIAPLSSRDRSRSGVPDSEPALCCPQAPPWGSFRIPSHRLIPDSPGTCGAICTGTPPRWVAAAAHRCEASTCVPCWQVLLPPNACRAPGLWQQNLVGGLQRCTGSQQGTACLWHPGWPWASRPAPPICPDCRTCQDEYGGRGSQCVCACSVLARQENPSLIRPDAHPRWATLCKPGVRLLAL